MANYIDKEVLCEGYTHINSDLASDPTKLAELKRTLTDFFNERAKFLLGQDVEIRVEFEDGSLKTRISAIGAAGVILAGAISQYGGFRDGISLLAKDATTLAQSANLELLFRTRAAHCDRINVESRKGVFGRVESLIRELDGIVEKLRLSKLPTNQKAAASFDSIVDELLEWDRKSDKLFEKFDSPHTTGCVSTGLAEELEKIPETVSWAEDLLQDSLRTQTLNADPQAAAQVFAVAERYKRVIQALRKKMLDRVKQESTKLG